MMEKICLRKRHERLPLSAFFSNVIVDAEESLVKPTRVSVCVEIVLADGDRSTNLCADHFKSVSKKYLYIQGKKILIILIVDDDDEVEDD
jgi:hypothetical protein